MPFVSYLYYRTLNHIILQMARFSGEVIEYKMSVTLLQQITYEKFLILIRIQRDIIINKHTSSCKLPVIIVEF